MQKELVFVTPIHSSLDYGVKSEKGTEVCFAESAASTVRHGLIGNRLDWNTLGNV